MSIKTKKVKKEYNEMVSVTCSKCRRVITPAEWIDWQEVYTISFTGGYGSVFGDGVTVRVDLCQQCLFDLVDGFYEVEEEVDPEDM